MHIDIENAGKIAIYNGYDVFEIMQKIFYNNKKEEADLMKEHFWTFSLNKRHKIMNIELVGIGSKDRVIADPGDVFRVPIYKSASYVVLVHNHPSGGLTPSKTDIDHTNRLMKAGDILNIRVIEHVIMSSRSYYSFKESGLIEKLELDTSYALSFIYEKRMKEKLEGLKLEVEKKTREIKKRRTEGEKREKKGEEKGAKQQKQEIARKMISKNIDLKLIQEVTGLSSQWVGRLKREIEKSKE